MEVRRFAVGSQSEGCVFDDEAQALYIGEELKGVWRYGADPASGDSRTLLHGIDQSGRLIDDVAGITLIRSQGRTYLLVTSQGERAFARWRVDGDQTGRASCRERVGPDGLTSEAPVPLKQKTHKPNHP